MSLQVFMIQLLLLQLYLFICYDLLYSESVTFFTTQNFFGF